MSQQYYNVYKSILLEEMQYFGIYSYICIQKCLGHENKTQNEILWHGFSSSIDS